MKKITVAVLLSFFLLLQGCTPASGLPIVKAQQVVQRLENKETLVVIIGQSTCSACIQYKPIIEEILNNYDVNLAYVEWDKDNRDDVTELVINHLIEANATPTTYIFIDGELTFTRVGLMDYRQLKALLQQEGFID